MANDGTSSMSGMGMAIAPGTTAPGRQRGLPVRDTAVGTVITAEIPAVPVGPSYGVLLPDGSVWYPGSRKRLPAPLILRTVVWILAFAVFLAGAGDFVIRYHPTWVSPLRHIVPAPSAPAAAAGGSTATSTTLTSNKGTTAGAAGITLMKPQPACLPPNTTAYSVATSAYTVTVTAGPRAAWVGNFSFSNCQHSTLPVQQKTLVAQQRYLINPTTSVDLIQIGANGTTIRVYHVLTLLATVPTPARCPCFVYLQPAHH